ncbi:hypothetical protein [Companilactobacillus sp. HBUAS59699]|uniref:hypothetical protein n=1 Tax=Companilactobacillus sp. HBUAS59699 TaxID=3109358 RepID=UPI002FEEA972
MKQYFTGKNKKKTWIIVAVVIVVLIVFFNLGTHRGDNSGGTSIAAPKKISFVKQARENGTHIWFYTQSENNDIAKDSPIYYVYILKNKRMQQYKMFDDNITLGKLSKMNNQQVTQLAEKQDKKFVTTGMISEIKNGRSGVTTDITRGDDETADGIINIFSVNKIDESGGSQGTAIKIINSDNFNYGKKLPDGYGKDESGIESMAPGIVKISDNVYRDSIIKHIKKSKYKEPKKQSIKVKNITDNSGNKVIRQEVSYDSYDMFVGDQADENVYHLALKNKSEFLKLLNLSRTSSYIVDPNDTEVLNEEITRQNQGKELYTKLISDHVDDITKDIYGYHSYSSGLTLNGPFVSQQIYNTRFIGYTNKVGYLLTKAQNDKQKIEFGK